MTIHLNKLSDVYLEQIYESAVPGKPAEKVGALTNIDIPQSERDAARERLLAKSAALRAKKGIKEEERKVGGGVKKGGGYERGYEAMKKEIEKLDGGEEPATRRRYKEMNNEALDPVGQEDDDIDNDGQENDENDKYIRRKRLAISKSIKSKNKIKKVQSESFSNWRQDLIEVIDSDKVPSKMKEKKVDNYSGNDKCITINPEVKEEIRIIESIELSEEYIDETVYGAVDYFMAEGLNDKGIEILIDELGLDEFVSFVFEIGNEVLTEARTLLGKKKNPQKLPKGTAPSQATKAAVAKYGTTRKFKSSSTSGIVKKNRPVAKAVEKAKETQPTKKPVRDAIARGVFGAVRAYQQGMKRHRAAMDAARETGKTIAKAAQVGARGASEFGKGVASGAKATVNAAKKAKKVINAGYEMESEFVDEEESYMDYAKRKAKERKDTRHTVTAADKKANTPAYQKLMKGDPKYKAASHLNAGYELQGSVIDEKATSEQQQKLFGLALSVKRGQTPRSEASAEVLKIVDSMSEKKIRDFAKTKHKGIPKKVEEELAPTTPQQIAAQKQVAVAQDKLNKANKKALSKNTQVEEYLDEKKIPVTRQAGDFRYPGRTGEEKGLPKADRLSKSKNPEDRRRGNKMRSRLKTAADRDTAQASSAARQKLYRGQQLRANDLANQLIKAKGNVNSGYELEGDLVNETTPLFYKLQKAGKKGSSTAAAQTRPDADLQRQKNVKMNMQKAKQRQERETDDDHPSLSARERNPNLR